MNPRSSASRGQEHWPRLRICKYGQRLGPLNTSTTVPHLLPQDWNCPEESLKKGDNARHKYIACTFCLRALSGAISRVLISTIATAAAMAGGVACNVNYTFSTTVHEPRDRTGLPTVAGAHFGVSLDFLSRREGTCDSQCDWAKQKQTVRSAFQTDHRVQLWELGGRRESVLRCSVAQKAGHVVQKSRWNGDLSCADFHRRHFVA